MVIGLLVVLFFICIVIVVAILLQEDKSGGAVGILGGSSQSFFGANSGSMLAKFSAIMLAIFLIVGVLIAIVSSHVGIQANFTKSDIVKAKLSRYNIEGINSSNEETINYVPLQFPKSEFENNILSKITNKDNKIFLSALYQNKEGVYNYNFKKFKKSDIYASLSKDNKKEKAVKDKALKLLQGINYSQKAKTTNIELTDETTD